MHNTNLLYQFLTCEVEWLIPQASRKRYNLFSIILVKKLLVITVSNFVIVTLKFSEQSKIMFPFKLLQF